MKTGISLYPGLGRSCVDELALLEEAASMGITRVFTSLQMQKSSLWNSRKFCPSPAIITSMS